MTYPTTTTTSSSTSPKSIPIPPPPPLDPSSFGGDSEENTNTLALLLPHQALFAPPVLALLREHYASFGEIIHWAPVRGFGRVIVVFGSEEGAQRAKKEGDWLRLDLSTQGNGESRREQEQEQELQQHGAREQEQANVRTSDQAGDMDGTRDIEAAVGESNAASQANGEGYFGQKRGGRRKKSTARPNEIILRLYYLPPTPLYPDPATTHLAPPALPHNFLISPPGSPPEGWEPIAEEAPNTSILAEDLQRALESLALNSPSARHGAGIRDDGKEVILEEGGVRVEVEDTDKGRPQHSDGDQDTDIDVNVDVEIEERIQGAEKSSIWSHPSQVFGVGVGAGDAGSALASASASAMGLGGIPGGGGGGGGASAFAGLGGLSGSGTPMGKMKIIPTAMPPR